MKPLVRLTMKIMFLWLSFCFWFCSEAIDIINLEETSVAAGIANSGSALTITNNSLLGNSVRGTV